MDRCEAKRCRQPGGNLYGALGYAGDPIDFCDRHFELVIETPNDQKLAVVQALLRRPHERAAERRPAAAPTHVKQPVGTPAPRRERAKKLRGKASMEWACAECGDVVQRQDQPGACRRCGKVSWQGQMIKSPWGTPGTAAELTRRLIMAGPGTNAEIHAAVVHQLGAAAAGPLKNVAWYRNWLKRHGHNPPAGR